ncbi:MAG: hypothetical protein ACK4UO_13895 [Pseudolabrys sp.]
MRLKVAATAIAIIGALGLLVMPADAQTKKKRTVYTNRGNTVVVTRDEDGRTRTRVIVQRRSYLDPGTERFPGERSNYDYAVMPNQRATSVLDNTAFGGNQSALPNLWTLPSKNNPFLQY